MHLELIGFWYVSGWEHKKGHGWQNRRQGCMSVLKLHKYMACKVWTPDSRVKTSNICAQSHILCKLISDHKFSDWDKALVTGINAAYTSPGDTPTFTSI